MKYLPEFKVKFNPDSIDNLRSIEFGFYKKDTIGNNTFVPWIRISYTYKKFFQEVSSHGWGTNYNGNWYSIDDDINDVAYIEGENWRCLQGLETVIFYDENNYKGYGDKLKYLAMIERVKKPSLMFELLKDSNDDWSISGEELYTMLS